MESWKPIPNLNDYMASDKGQIKSINHYTLVYNGHKFFKRFFHGKILKPCVDKDGYFYLIIRKKRYFVHRLIAICFLQNPNNYPQVDHLNNDKLDNRPQNLKWCHQSENISYALRKGFITHKIADFYSLSKKDIPKLSQQQIESIRRKYANKKNNKCTYQTLAKEYNVHKDTIGIIIHRKRYYSNH